MNSKTLTLCALAFFAFAPASAQESEFITDTNETGPFLLSAEELDELLGPVALHPDALVALVLPAATVPEDIVLAARFLERGENPDLIDDQTWAESVRALARYPDMIKWLNENLEWTIEVGDAFMAQPDDVMNSIQRLRSIALEAGTLTNTPQQYVVEEKEVVRIVPANPTVIYVPYYDPDVVYVRRAHYSYVPRSYFTFSVGFGVGSWLTYDCDWIGHRIWHVQNRRYWNTYRDWRNPRFPGYYGYVPHPHRHPWTPPSRRYNRRDRDHHRSHQDFVDSRPNQSSPRQNEFDRRRNVRSDRNNVGQYNPDNDRRRDSQDRNRTRTPGRGRDGPAVAPPVPDRRPSAPPPPTRVASPRENIINVLRERSAQTSRPARQPRPTQTGAPSEDRRAAAIPRAETSSPRAASPRERTINVLRAERQSTPARTTRAENTRSNRQEAAVRTERQAPRAETRSPRAASPRERTINVLRAERQSTPARAIPADQSVRQSAPARATRAENTRSNRQEAAVRTERRAPLVIHGRTISRNDSSSGRQTSSAE